jgi:hypothetical protein
MMMMMILDDGEEDEADAEGKSERERESAVRAKHVLPSHSLSILFLNTYTHQLFEIESLLIVARRRFFFSLYCLKFHFFLSSTKQLTIATIHDKFKQTREIFNE